MAENNSINIKNDNKWTDIEQGLDRIRTQFENLIRLNPYILYRNSPQSYSRKFKKYTYLYSLLFLGIGLVFGLIPTIVSFLCDTDKNWLRYSMNFTSAVFTIIISVSALIMRQMGTEESHETKYIWIIVATVSIASVLPALFGYYKDQRTYGIFVYLIMLFILLISFFSIFFPLSGDKTRKEIAKAVDDLMGKMDEIRDEKKAIFLEEINESHKSIEGKIAELKNNLINDTLENNTNLHKLLQLSVLEALKIELVQSSSRALELTRNWQFVKLTQKMLDKIMEADNKNNHITLVGDLSFLSHEKGLQALFDTVIHRNKTFDIYFTGMITQNNTVHSDYFDKLVTAAQNVTSNYSDFDKTTLKGKICIKLMPSFYFTGLGFIGLKEKREKADFNEVYSFVSSSILPDSENENIAEANPFVFSWNDKTHYFREFIAGINKKVNKKPPLQLEYNGEKCGDIMSFLVDYQPNEDNNGKKPSDNNARNGGKSYSSYKAQSYLKKNTNRKTNKRKQ